VVIRRVIAGVYDKNTRSANGAAPTLMNPATIMRIRPLIQLQLFQAGSPVFSEAKCANFYRIYDMALKKQAKILASKAKAGSKSIVIVYVMLFWVI